MLRFALPRPPGSSFTLTSIQTRHYAGSKKRIAPKKRTVMGKKKKGDEKQQRLQEMIKSQGQKFTYRPVSAAQLAHPIFSVKKAPPSYPPFDASPSAKHLIGQPRVFTHDLLFKAYGVPRSLVLEFRLLSKPCTVVREVTLEVSKILEAAKDQSSIDSRVVLTGDPGSGKSFVLLQAVHHALNSGWIVLYIPRAISFLNSSSRYQYDLRTQTYQQPAIAQQILTRFASVNGRLYSSLTIQRPVPSKNLRRLEAGMPLSQLIDTGMKDINMAPDALDALLEELGAQTDYPVLLAVDDFQALYCKSQYRDPEYRQIQSHHLSIPRLLLEYAGGLKSFSKGAVLGALSSTHTGFPIPLELREGLGLPYARPTGPYAKRWPAKIAYAQGLRALEVPPLTAKEAGGLIDLWAKNLSLHEVLSDELFHTLYAESGGNARSFLRRGALATL